MLTLVIWRSARSAIGSRLSGEVTRALELANGRDPTPLVAYQPPRSVVEEVSFEHGVSGVEPLRFALRGLTARLSARLGGRGMAAESLLLGIEHDRSIAAWRSPRRPPSSNSHSPRALARRRLQPS